MNIGRRASSLLDDRGAESQEQLNQWDQFYALRFQEFSLMSERLLGNLQRGLYVGTDFSGFDAPRECFRIMTCALDKEFGAQLSDHVHFVRSCDLGVLQKKCLMLQSDMFDAGGSCVFSDVLDRLNPDARDWIKTAGPTKTMSLQGAQAANQLVEQFVQRSKGQLFMGDGCSYCEMHRQRCPAFISAVLQSKKDSGEASSSASVAGVSAGSDGDGSVSVSPTKMKKQSYAGKPWHEGALNLSMGSDEDMPVVCNISGLVCTDYTPLGKQRGLVGAGLTEPVHAVWIAERRYLASHDMEDWFFTENSSKYPVEAKQVAALCETHDVKYVHVCPSKLNYPMHRRRTFTFGVNRRLWVWVGPTCPGDIQMQFDMAFGAETQFTGDMYFMADATTIHKFAEERASRRGKKLPADFRQRSMKEYLSCLVPPGAMVRLSQYEKVRPELESLDGSFLVDLDHNLGCGPACGPLTPALDTHPCIFSFKHERLALGSELLGAQGVDMFQGMAGNRGLSPLKRVFEQLGDADQRFLAGNTMHIPSLSAWMFFAISNVRSRAELSRLPKRMSQPEKLVEDEGDQQKARRPRLRL